MRSLRRWVPTMNNVDQVIAAVAHFAVPAERELYLSLYGPDIRFHGYGAELRGIDAVRSYYGAFWTAFPDATVSVEDAFEGGDRVAVRYLIQGTQRGAFAGLAVTGRSICLPGMSIFRFKEGLCVERWASTDSGVLLAQLTGSTR